MKKPEYNVCDLFSSEQLSEKELATVLGGTKPKTRDKDIYDLDEEE